MFERSDIHSSSMLIYFSLLPCMHFSCFFFISSKGQVCIYFVGLLMQVQKRPWLKYWNIFCDVLLFGFVCPSNTRGSLNVTNRLAAGLFFFFLFSFSWDSVAALKNKQSNTNIKVLQHLEHYYFTATDGLMSEQAVCYQWNHPTVCSVLRCSRLSAVCLPETACSPAYSCMVHVVKIFYFILFFLGAQRSTFDPG